MGSEVVAGLAGEYTVVALVRRPGSAPADGTRVIEVPADLQDASWRERLRERLKGRRIYGVVHAAWPRQPHGSLLQLDGAAGLMMTFEAGSPSPMAANINERRYAPASASGT